MTTDSPPAPTLNELLHAASRTFALGIDILPSPLRDEIEVAYLLLSGELPTAEYGSGHVWFFDIALGLQLPIDEHRVRRGR